MTRDEAVSVNLVTGETTYPSDREPEQDYSASGDMAGAAIHGKVREVDQKNFGVQSGHLGERNFEKVMGYGNCRVQNWRTKRKLKPWRDAAKAEQAAVKANADFYYRKAVAENPQLASNPISRLWQKRKLQKQYAAAYWAVGKTTQAGKTAETMAKAAKKTAQESKHTALFLKRYWKGALIVSGINLLLVLLGSLQSGSSMFGGGVSNIMVSSYLSKDSDMLAAKEAYCAKEVELREYLDTYEATHDYDEYHFDLDEIEYDPYVLVSILSAIHEEVFTIDQIQGDLQPLFDKQYILTETVTTETCYWTETRTDSKGNEYKVEVPYTWYICTVTLEGTDRLPEGLRQRPYHPVRRNDGGGGSGGLRRRCRGQ